LLDKGLARAFLRFAETRGLVAAVRGP